MRDPKLECPGIILDIHTNIYNAEFRYKVYWLSGPNMDTNHTSRVWAETMLVKHADFNNV